MTSTVHMTCEDIWELLPLLPAGELSAQQAAEALRHIGSCPDCLQAYIQERDLRKAMQTLGEADALADVVFASLTAALDRQEEQADKPLLQQVYDNAIPWESIQRAMRPLHKAQKQCQVAADAVQMALRCVGYI